VRPYEQGLCGIRPVVRPYEQGLCGIRPVVRHDAGRGGWHPPPGAPSRNENKCSKLARKYDAY
jgi:hypothetical protein